MAADHVMLQTQLLHTAKKLAKCLGAQSTKLYPFTDPVLRFAITQVATVFYVVNSLIFLGGF